MEMDTGIFELQAEAESLPPPPTSNGNGEVAVAEENVVNALDSEAIAKRITDNPPGQMDLSCASLTNFRPKSILKGVQCLDLSHNNLKSLDNAFSSVLHKLTWLDVSQNELKGLPYNIDNLVNLQHLDAHDNQIEQLPLSMGRLRQLQWVNVRNNPLNETMLQICGECLDFHQCRICAMNVVPFMQQIEQHLYYAGSLMEKDDAIRNIRVGDAGVDEEDELFEGNAEHDALRGVNEEDIGLLKPGSVSKLIENFDSTKLVKCIAQVILQLSCLLISIPTGLALCVDENTLKNVFNYFGSEWMTNNYIPTHGKFMHIVRLGAGEEHFLPLVRYQEPETHWYDALFSMWNVIYGV